MSPEARERRIEATWAGLPVRGVSVAGRETWFHLPTLHLTFDLGRTPTALVSVPNVFLSHAHLDHGAGLAYWCSQRRLLRLAGGTARTHPAAVPAWTKILALHEALEAVRYDARVEAMESGSRVSLRRDLEVEAFEADHRVPTLGFVAFEIRNRLREDLAGHPPGEIREAAARGESVAEKVAVPLVAYSGDTGAGVFARAPRSFFTAKVLLLECSFVDESDRERSEMWKHLHLDEIAERADLFENEVVVLTHLTLRTTPDEIRRTVARRLPPRLAARTVPFLPE
ncbi:MAG TPA: MBL fold metallo-hydrolase [Thermoanaerobaculia bacterium]|nr:MBL fold metallo-hydrolase [Thermoanaerobaculia bacterium]